MNTLGSVNRKGSFGSVRFSRYFSSVGWLRCRTFSSSLCSCCRDSLSGFVRRTKLLILLLSLLFNTWSAELSLRMCGTEMLRLASDKWNPLGEWGRLSRSHCRPLGLPLLAVRRILLRGTSLLSVGDAPGPIRLAGDAS